MRRPRLRTLLLLINLVILVLPLAGIWFLRLYESALIRQTESELIAQAAVLASAFRVERQRLKGDVAAPIETPDTARSATQAHLLDTIRSAGLDLADDPVLPPPADPAQTDQPATPLAAAAGRSLTPVLHDAQQAALAALRIVDRQGVIVSTTGDDLGLSLMGREEISRALGGELASVMRRREHPTGAGPASISRGADLRVFVAMPVIDGDQVVGAVLLSRTPRDVVQAIYGKRFYLLAVGGIMLGAAILLALVASRLITGPLAKVVAQARQVAATGGPIEPLTGAGTREAAELSAAVGRMADTLARRADYIRSFAAHVSHEFKTPLAGAKGAVELLGDHLTTMSDAERRRFLGVIGGSLDRLERLVRRLLDLARADMTGPSPAAALALQPSLERIAARYRAAGLAVTVRADDRAGAALAEDALDILLASLLDNARQHAGVDAHVTIDAVQMGDRIVITVADDGPGLPSADLPHIFEPFFTTARAHGGTGLGLSIARAVATGAGGTIEPLVSCDGATFRVTLPATPPR
jgi:signal transduction histidine kinase